MLMFVSIWGRRSYNSCEQFCMRIPVPASRATFSFPFSVFDILWASFSPLLALYVRDAFILSYEGAVTIGIYCGVSLTFSMISFFAFRLRDGMTPFFSV